MAAGKILLSKQEIEEIIKELGGRINRDYEGKDLVVLGVLKGAFMFMADLIREIDLPLTCEFVRVSSYGPDGKPGHLRLEFDLTQSVVGKDVLVLEDLVDTGTTLQFLKHHLQGKGAKSVRFCTLIKKENAPEELPLDYYGKVIPPDYVVGFGMDLNGRFRNLPWIGYPPSTKS
ncbi:MAG: hypoxanthine phosphoribosyltransferase [bacterium]|nr:hypoxanthine phosphoribosyltransferase [bacterium]